MSPVSNIAFNNDGSLFAYMVGDDASLGMHADWKWGVGYFVRSLLDDDLKPNTLNQVSDSFLH